AIEYAHSRGVLHRDLKPGNIMLGKYGETLVVDWGLAKLKGRDDSSRTAEETTLVPSSGSGSAPTQMGSAIGTPAYMPPEQATGNLDELGPASDVYSLGATLYYLLTGQAPVQGKQLVEILQRVRSGEIPPPREINAAIPKPLEAICQRAMALRPADRYATPLGLADDIERFMADEPIAAHTEPLSIRTRRWMRKHPKTIATIAATLMVGLTSTIVISAVVAGKNEELAKANTDLISANVAEREATEEANAKRKEAEEAREQERIAKLAATEKQREAEGNLYASRISLAGREIEAGNVETALGLLRKCPTNQRDWEWRYLYGLIERSCSYIQVPGGLSRESAAFSSDSKTLAVHANVDFVSFIDWQTRREFRRINGLAMGPLPVQFSPDGKRILASRMDKRIGIFDVATGEEVASPIGVAGAMIHSMALSNDGTRLALVDIDSKTSKKRLAVWDTESANVLFENLIEHSNTTGVQVHFNEDGNRVLTGGPIGMDCWDATTGKQKWHYGQYLNHIDVSGSHVVTGTMFGSTIQDVETAKSVVKLSGHGIVTDVVYSWDGNSVAYYDDSNRLHVLWSHGDLRHKFVCPKGRGGLLFSLDGTSLIALTSPIQVWDLERGELPYRYRNARGRAAAMSPDGNLAAWSEENGIVIRDTELATGIHEIELEKAVVTSLAWSPNGEWLYAGDETGRVRCFAREDWSQRWSQESHESPIQAIDTSGLRVAIGDKEGRISILDQTSGEVILTELGSVAIKSIRWRPNTDQLGIVSSNGSVILWDVTGKGKTRIPSQLLAIDFSPDGKQIVGAPQRGSTLEIWDLETRTLLRTLSGHHGAVEVVRYLGSGKRIASASSDRDLRIWDPAMGISLLTERKHFTSIKGVFSSSRRGDRLLTFDAGSYVRIWDAATSVADAEAVLQHVRNGDLESMRASVQELLEQDGEIEGLLELGDAIASAFQFESAFRVFQRRSIDAPDDVEGLVKLATLAAFLGRQEECDEARRTLLSKGILEGTELMPFVNEELKELFAHLAPKQPDAELAAWSAFRTDRLGTWLLQLDRKSTSVPDTLIELFTAFLQWQKEKSDANRSALSAIIAANNDMVFCNALSSGSNPDWLRLIRNLTLQKEISNRIGEPRNYESDLSELQTYMRERVSILRTAQEWVLSGYVDKGCEAYQSINRFEPGVIGPAWRALQLTAALGKHAEYRQICERILLHGNEVALADPVIRNLFLMPLDPAQMDRLVAVAGNARATLKSEENSREVDAWVAFRTGKFISWWNSTLPESRPGNWNLWRLVYLLEEWKLEPNDQNRKALIALADSFERSTYGRWPPIGSEHTWPWSFLLETAIIREAREAVGSPMLINVDLPTLLANRESAAAFESQAKEAVATSDFEAAVSSYEKVHELIGPLFDIASTRDLYTRMLRWDKAAEACELSYERTHPWTLHALFAANRYDDYRVARKLAFQAMDQYLSDASLQFHFTDAVTLLPLEEELHDHARRLADKLRQTELTEAWQRLRLGRLLNRLGEFDEWFAAQPEQDGHVTQNRIASAISVFQKEPSGEHRSQLQRLARDWHTNLIRQIDGNGLINPHWPGFIEQLASYRDALRALGDPLAESAGEDFLLLAQAREHALNLAQQIRESNDAAAERMKELLAICKTHQDLRALGVELANQGRLHLALQAMAQAHELAPEDLDAASKAMELAAYLGKSAEFSKLRAHIFEGSESQGIADGLLSACLRMPLDDGQRDLVLRLAAARQSVPEEDHLSAWIAWRTGTMKSWNEGSTAPSLLRHSHIRLIKSIVDHQENPTAASKFNLLREARGYHGWPWRILLEDEFANQWPWGFVGAMAIVREAYGATGQETDFGDIDIEQVRAEAQPSRELIAQAEAAAKDNRFADAIASYEQAAPIAGPSFNHVPLRDLYARMLQWDKAADAYLASVDPMDTRTACLLYAAGRDDEFLEIQRRFLSSWDGHSDAALWAIAEAVTLLPIAPELHEAADGLAERLATLPQEYPWQTTRIGRLGFRTGRFDAWYTEQPKEQQDFWETAILRAIDNYREDASDENRTELQRQTDGLQWHLDHAVTGNGLKDPHCPNFIRILALYRDARAALEHAAIGDAEARTAGGDYLKLARDREKAESLAAKIDVEADPATVAEQLDELVEIAVDSRALIDLGNKLALRGRIRLAYQALRQAHELDPANRVVAVQVMEASAYLGLYDDYRLARSRFLAANRNAEIGGHEIWRLFLLPLEESELEILTQALKRRNSVPEEDAIQAWVALRTGTMAKWSQTEAAQTMFRRYGHIRLIRAIGDWEREPNTIHRYTLLREARGYYRHHHASLLDGSYQDRWPGDFLFETSIARRAHTILDEPLDLGDYDLQSLRTSSKQAEQWIEQAKQETGQGNLAGAIKLYGQAEEALGPSYDSLAAGDLHARMLQWDEAADDYLRSVGPTHPFTLQLLQASARHDDYGLARRATLEEIDLHQGNWLYEIAAAVAARSIEEDQRQPARRLMVKVLAVNASEYWRRAPLGLLLYRLDADEFEKWYSAENDDGQQLLENRVLAAIIAQRREPSQENRANLQQLAETVKTRLDDLVKGDQLVNPYWWSYLRLKRYHDEAMQAIGAAP
ncbi:MAG: protein kinase, partial [Planctomycetales bacterium]|nr:protein kinase [Planctomycetales bacterium]